MLYKNFFIFLYLTISHFYSLSIFTFVFYLFVFLYFSYLYSYSLTLYMFMLYHFRLLYFTNSYTSPQIHILNNLKDWKTHPNPQSHKKSTFLALIQPFFVIFFLKTKSDLFKKYFCCSNLARFSTVFCCFVLTSLSAWGSPGCLTPSLMPAPLQTYTIKNLRPFTQYLVSLQVTNPEGAGPPSTIAVMTDEGGEKRYELFPFERASAICNSRLHTGQPHCAKGGRGRFMCVTEFLFRNFFYKTFFNL